MHIVLPGALPDPAAARALLPQLTQTAPTLVRWLSLGHARLYPASGHQTGCTPEEYWQLHLRGYQPSAEQNQASGLGPLQAGNTDDEAVWLAELVHISPTQHGASLLTSAELSLTAAEDQALFDSLAALGDSGDFTLQPHQPGCWRVKVPTGFSMQGASPAQVARSAVNDWWPQQEQARSWRRLFNEAQMLWFDHPVNQHRQTLGLPPINGLWLFGGATRMQLDTSSDTSVQWHDALLSANLRQDWGLWLQLLAQLDSDVLQPLAQQGLTPSLALTGSAHIVEITPSRQPGWLRKLTGRTQTWRNWWLHQD